MRDDDDHFYSSEIWKHPQRWSSSTTPSPPAPPQRLTGQPGWCTYSTVEAVDGREGGRRGATAACRNNNNNSTTSTSSSRRDTRRWIDAWCNRCNDLRVFLVGNASNSEQRGGFAGDHHRLNGNVCNKDCTVAPPPPPRFHGPHVHYNPGCKSKRGRKYLIGSR